MRKLIAFIVVIAFVVNACRQDRMPPTAVCSAFPLFCDTTVLFEFEAGKSVNNLGFSSGLSYRWDFENDGTWDTDWRTESGSSHRFPNPGKYTVVVEVADDFGFSDTASVEIETFGRNRDISTMQDPRDGHVYSIAKFRGYWWMRENLEFGKVLNPYDLPTDNGIVEQSYGIYQGTTDTVFGLYDWKEAMNYGYGAKEDICPPGWHIPSVEEWDILSDGFSNTYAVGFYGREGLSGLELQNGHVLIGWRHDSIATLTSIHEYWARDFLRRSNSDIQIGVFKFNQQEYSNYVNAGFNVLESKDFYDENIIQLKSIRCIKKD